MIDLIGCTKAQDGDTLVIQDAVFGQATGKVRVLSNSCSEDAEYKILMNFSDNHAHSAVEIAGLRLDESGCALLIEKLQSALGEIAACRAQ